MQIFVNNFNLVSKICVSLQSKYLRKYAKKMYYLLIDEVQRLDFFEEVLNSFLKKSNVEVYVTVSNAQFLSRDVITIFRGRSDEVRPPTNI